MAKFTPKNLLSGFADVDSLAENFANLETLSNTWLSRDGTSPNGMLDDLDMNSNDIINAGSISASELIVDGASVSGSIQLAEDWATKTDGIVDNTDYSSKEYAIGSIVPEGSSKEWAVNPFEELVDGSSFSAFHWAQLAKTNFFEGTASEDITLTSGQLVVDFNDFIVAGAAFYVIGDNADNGRITETRDYTVTGDKQVTLLNSYPAGTILKAAQAVVDTLGGSASEDTVLTSGQTVVTFTNFTVTGAGLYIIGLNADNGRLTSPEDYTVSAGFQVLLTNSYPAGTILKAVKTETGETGAVEEAVAAAEAAETSADEAAASALQAANIAGDIASQQITYTVKTASFSPLNGEAIAADTSAASFTITLPASPTAGDTIRVVDYSGTFATNPCIVGRNGENIQGLAADLNLNINFSSTDLKYVDSTKGWLLV